MTHPNLKALALAAVEADAACLSAKRQSDKLDKGAIALGGVDMNATDVSPSASTGKDGVVERVARAIAKVIGDDDWEKADYFINTADDTIQTTQDLYRDIARAALAAIGER